MISPFHFIQNYRATYLMLFFTLSLSLHPIFKLRQVLFCNSVLNFILIFNCLSLIPFSYSITSYFWSTILVSIVICFDMFFIKLSKHSNWFLSNITPLGCPIFLWILLVNLERISLIIQPFTLSIRLACNLIAGHIILFLMSLSRHILVLLSIFLIFEAGICCIQSHVFSMLLAEYLCWFWFTKRFLVFLKILFLNHNLRVICGIIF